MSAISQSISDSGLRSEGTLIFEPLKDFVYAYRHAGCNHSRTMTVCIKDCRGLFRRGDKERGLGIGPWGVLLCQRHESTFASHSMRRSQSNSKVMVTAESLSIAYVGHMAICIIIITKIHADKRVSTHAIMPTSLRYPKRITSSPQTTARHFCSQISCR